MILACDLMTQNPTTIRESASIRDAAEWLHTLDVRHLPVVNSEGTLVGMLSDRDLRIVRTETGTDPSSDQRVATFMTPNVLSVDMEADVIEIVDLMLDNKVGAIPVVDGDGALVGIVSYVDVLRETTASLG